MRPPRKCPMPLRATALIHVKGRAFRLPGGIAVKGPRMRNCLAEFARDESGATAIEYGLIAAAVSLVIITVVNRLGSQLKTTFTTISSQLATAGR